MQTISPSLIATEGGKESLLSSSQKRHTKVADRDIAKRTLPAVHTSIPELLCMAISRIPLEPFIASTCLN
jgi:hypothetical protein